MNENEKMIFAKATAAKFCAIAVYVKNNRLMVCDVIEADNIASFIKELVCFSRSHRPYLVKYECSVYLNECRYLRACLIDDNIPVSGYNSVGKYMDRIVSQADWIDKNVLINEKFEDFADQVSSFGVHDEDRDNIAIDVLSDAAIYLRRRCFE
ncbi:MAG: hypothetical protein LBG96_16705 [Tannerella sp.]|jgi:hypothetical protein|nr:hypothetical protein [Tannerella sp.]